MADKSVKLSLKNFTAFVTEQNDQFCRSDCAILEKYLIDDGLVVKDEKEAFDALQQWVMHSPKERFAEVPKLLPLIRLNQLESDFLEKTVKQFAVEGGCVELIKGAIERQNLPLHQRDEVIVDFYTKPRKSATEITIVAVCTEDLLMHKPWRTTVQKYSTKTKEWDELLVDGTIEKFELGEGLSTMHGKHNLIVCDHKSRQFYSLNLVTMEAEPLPKPLKQVGSFCMEVVDEKLHVFGIDPASMYRNPIDMLLSRSPVNDVQNVPNGKAAAQRFNFKTRKWSSIQPMSICCYGRCSAVLNDKIYVAGGAPKSGLERFDPKSGRWTTLASTLRQRCNADMTSSDKYLYLFGGRGFSDRGNGPGALKSVERYDPDKNEWTIIAELDDFVYGFATVAILDRVYLIGGEDVSNKSIGCVLNKFRGEAEASKPCAIFDMKSEKFTGESIPKMPLNLSWPAVAYYINE